MPLPGEQTGGEFSLKTHYFDHRGRKLGEQPYRLHINSDGEHFERPVGSGNLYHPNGKAAGRYLYEKNSDGTIKTKTYDAKAKHAAWIAPLSGAEKVEAELVAEKQKSAQLLSELEAIKSEQKGKAQVQKDAAPPQATGKQSPPTLDVPPKVVN